MENLEQDSAYIVTCAEFGCNTCKGFFCGSVMLGMVGVKADK